MNKKSIAGIVALVAGLSLATTAMAATFTTTLKLGSKGAEVKALQVVLNSDASTQVAATGAGSAGNETTTFGPATKRAVIKFQEKYAADILTPAGLTKGTGVVGPSTRKKLNAMGGTVTVTPVTSGSSTTTTTTTTTSGTGLSVTISSDSPANGTVVSGQATADLAHFTFTNNGSATAKVTNVTLNRTGVSNDTTINNAYLFKGNARLSDSASVSSGKISFNDPTGLFTLAPGASLNVSVRADIAASTAGQVLGVALASVTSDATVGGTFPIMGNYMTIALATLASINVGANTVTGSPTVNAGTMAYSFWSTPVTVSQRAVALKGATFKFVGSATNDAIQNLKLYLNGTAVGNASSVDASGKLNFDFGASPVTVNTGASTLELRGDIVKGSSRTASFVLQNAGDLIAADSQLGVNVAVTSPTTASFTQNTGATVSINAGSVTTTIDPAFNSVTNVTGGATGATIGKFKLQAYGEDVKVTTVSVTPAFSVAPTPAANGLNNVALFWNGAQIGSNQNMTGASTALTFSVGSSMIITAGTAGTLEVRADVQSAANANYTAGTITTTLTLGSSNGQGMSSQTTLNVPSATITTTGLTVSTGALTIAKNPGYTDQTVNPNMTNVKIGSFVLQNTSTAESVRVTNLAVGLSGTQALTALSNLRTSEAGTTPIQPAASNNFSVNFTLAPGATRNIDITADIGSATAASTTIVTLLPTATGASSNVSVTPGSATNGQTVTYQTGSVAVPTLVTSGSSVSQFVASGATGGATNGSLAQFNFVATNGTASITDLKFTVASSTGTPVSSVTVSGVTAPVVAGVATFTGLNIAVAPGAAGQNVNVYANYSQVGINAASSSATSTLSLTYMKYTIGGVTTSTSTISVAANAMTSVGSAPAISVATPAASVLATGSVEAIDVTITANAAGPVTINSFPITSTLSAGAGTPLFTAGSNNVVVKDANGNTLTTTSSAIASAATTTTTISFTGGYALAAGASQTFKVFMPVAAVGTGSLPNTFMYSNIATGTGFSWSDTAGNSTAAITGTTLFVNYPSTVTASVHN